MRYIIVMKGIYRHFIKGVLSLQTGWGIEIFITFKKQIFTIGTIISIPLTNSNKPGFCELLNTSRNNKPL